MNFRRILSLFSKEPESIIDVMDRHRLEVLRGEKKAVQAMLRAYRPIRALLEDRLEEIERLIAVALDEGVDPGVWLFEQYRYKAFLDEVEKEVNRFSARAEGEVKKSQASSAAMGTAHAQELMQIEVNVKRVFTQLPKAAIEQMVGALADGSPLRNLFQEFGTTARNKAHDIMVSGIAAGDSPRDTAKRLAEAIEDLSHERALVIARNESLRVLTTSQARNYEANSDIIDGMRIVSALDSRTCPLCWARHGTIIKLGEPFYRHICCRCALAPVTAYSKKWAKGEQEFALLTEDEQRKILKGSRYDMWKSGEIKFDDIYTLNQHKEWGPQIGLKPVNRLVKEKKPKGTYAPPVIEDGAKSVIKIRKVEGIVAK